MGLQRIKVKEKRKKRKREGKNRLLLKKLIRYLFAMYHAPIDLDFIFKIKI